jgi:two-component system response regulator HydG|tara:strand:+ start:2752 stop:4296 length:1545 start_codon:yes stop_codon:yes gene_type:complete
MIYFTIIGTRDSFVDIKDPFKTCGAALTIFMNYREDIDTVYLFTTKTGVERDQLYKEAADITEKLMKRQNKKLKFSQVELDFVPSPIDYMTVFHEMMAKIKTIMEEDNVLNIEKIINITSGTPTMTACWILLKQAGILPNSTLVQSFSKEVQRRRGKAVEEVNLDIENLPKIESRESIVHHLKRETLKTERLQEEIHIQDIHNKFSNLVGKSPCMTSLKKEILRLAPTDQRVLILGGSGTGKELVALSLHQHSNRKDNTFLKWNAGGKSSSAIESELFGHIKGAYTGAHKDRLGYFQTCDGGTLFINEIGDMPLDVQQKLLDAVEYGHIIPLGQDEAVEVDVRIVAATNRDISSMVQKEEFRLDLLTRFQGKISIEPLRNRVEDIPDLVMRFAPEVIFSKECVEAFKKEDWNSGNVRDLKNTCDQAKTIHKETPIERGDIPPIATDALKSQESDTMPQLPLPEGVSLDDLLNNIRCKYEDRAIRRNNNNMAEAARKDLNIKPATLQRSIQRRKK